MRINRSHSSTNNTDFQQTGRCLNIWPVLVVNVLFSLVFCISLKAAEIHTDKGIQDSHLAIDGSPETFVALNNFNDKLIIDLETLIASGEVLKVTWRRNSSYKGTENSSLVVKCSADGLNFIPIGRKPTSNSSEFITSSFTVKHALRYVMITVASPIDDALEISDVTTTQDAAKPNNIDNSNITQRSKDVTANDEKEIETENSQQDKKANKKPQKPRDSHNNTSSKKKRGNSKTDSKSHQNSVATLRQELFVVGRIKKREMRFELGNMHRTIGLDAFSSHISTDTNTLSKGESKSPNSLYIRPPP